MSSRMELGRQRRPHLYNLDIEKPRPPAPRRLRLEVNERMDADGNVQVPLDEEELEEIEHTLNDARTHIINSRRHHMRILRKRLKDKFLKGKDIEIIDKK